MDMTTSIFIKFNMLKHIVSHNLNISYKPHLLLLVTYLNLSIKKYSVGSVGNRIPSTDSIMQDLPVRQASVEVIAPSGAIAESELLIEIFRSDRRTRPDSLLTKDEQVIFWKLFDTVGDKDLAETCGILSIEKSLLLRSLAHLSKESRQQFLTQEGRENWRSIEEYNDPAVTIESRIAEKLRNTMAVQSQPGAVAFSEIKGDTARTKFLREKYKSLGPTTKKNAALKEGIYSAVWEVEGRGNRAATLNLLGINYAEYCASLDKLPGINGILRQTLRGNRRTKWRELSALKEAGEEVDGWLKEAHLDTPPAVDLIMLKRRRAPESLPSFILPRDAETAAASATLITPDVADEWGKRLRDEPFPSFEELKHR